MTATEAFEEALLPISSYFVNYMQFPRGCRLLLTSAAPGTPGTLPASHRFSPLLAAPPQLETPSLRLLILFSSTFLYGGP